MSLPIDVFREVWRATRDFFQRLVVAAFALLTGITIVGCVDWEPKPSNEGPQAFTPKYGTEDKGPEVFQPKYTTEDGEPTAILEAPIIESASTIPAGPLKPGSTVILKGKYFGVLPGKILLTGISGYTPNGVELEELEWANGTLISGIVPVHTNGKSNKTVHLTVIAYPIDLKTVSNSWPIEFQGREEKHLTRADVVLTSCSDEATTNMCNDVVVKKWPYEGRFVAGCADDLAICGSHWAPWGEVG